MAISCMMMMSQAASSTAAMAPRDGEGGGRRHHFVLVHGLCHGAWCWYRVATALRRAGHRVTALDMDAAGASPARVDEVRTFEDYSRPLLAALAALPPSGDGERVVLVGHSHGGFSVALAAERFPERLAAVVFLTASMPPVGRAMANTTDEYVSFVGADFFLDSRVLEQTNPDIPGNPEIFGPNFMAQKLYQLSPPEDLTLALSLIRPANRFTGDALMRDAGLLTKERYGSTRRVFVVVEDDHAIPVEFQRRMVAENPGVEVVDIAGADHMAMISKPAKLADLLVILAWYQEPGTNAPSLVVQPSTSHSSSPVAASSIVHDTSQLVANGRVLRHPRPTLELVADGHILHRPCHVGARRRWTRPPSSTPHARAHPPMSTGGGAMELGGGGHESVERRRRHQHHFVLVHGLCHGAWCWYKAAAALRRAGHRATALDMAASGAHPARVDEVRTFEDYSRPLLDALAALPPAGGDGDDEERVVLVGHSQGGFSVALAAERFPERVAAVVFLTAAMPPVGRPMSATTVEHVNYVGVEFFLDSMELEQQNADIPGNPVIFGPNFMAQILYHLSPQEDLTLGLSLIRPTNKFTGDALMRDPGLLTKERYGSTRRVFVVVEDDRGIPVEFQRRMIAENPGVEVVDFAGADHMAMISSPAKLAELLVRIADKAHEP
uniref:AB hydrolase-1 domain-containing protein n=1 Tax=Oryza rufipogon TaxID=4529 RepID=A0A0E0PLL0_ORYRU